MSVKTKTGLKNLAQRPAKNFPFQNVRLNDAKRKYRKLVQTVLREKLQRLFVCPHVQQ